jgi:CotS family spore coat protein
MWGIKLLNRLISINNDITHKEYESIKNLLKRYSITPDKVEKVRSVYKIICSNRNYCLKKMKHGNKKALKGLLLVEYLKKNGFDNAAGYIETTDGKECINTKHNIYYLTEWIEGNECTFNDIEEVKRAAVLLADFHNKSKGFASDDLQIRSNIKNWPKILQEEMQNLDTFKSIINNKKIKSSFDKEYLSAIKLLDEFFKLSINLLEKSHYMDISIAAKKENTLCHDSFYYQNVLVDKDGKMYLIDLDSTIYDIHSYDLAKFIRRVMFKSEYAWNFDAAKEIIASYCSINPLSKEEYEILLSFIIFPHKFWKLGKKRYIKKKKWTEDKYQKKLNRILKYLDREKEFINSFLAYYNIEQE